MLSSRERLHRPMSSLREMQSSQVVAKAIRIGWRLGSTFNIHYVLTAQFLSLAFTYSQHGLGRIGMAAANSIEKL